MMQSGMLFRRFTANITARRPSMGGAGPHGGLTAWKRSIASVTGRPLSLNLPSHPTIMVRLLAWRPTQVAWNRARLATSLARLLEPPSAGHVACDRLPTHLLSGLLAGLRPLVDHFTGYGIPESRVTKEQMLRCTSGSINAIA